MKNYLFVASILAIVSCSSPSTKNQSGTIAKDFISDPSSLEQLDTNKPLAYLQAVAAAQANKTVSFSKANINEVFEIAKEYKGCIIITGNHTAVKLESLDDCKQSGSWGACMPKGTGYIKKGKLVKQEDYINNIIGRPDDQERVAYFFK